MRIERSNPLASLLAARKSLPPVIILDGSLGTELERRGVSLKEGRLWSSQLLINSPSTLQAIHTDYYMAGSDVVTTATYQASIEGFREAGCTDAEAEQHLLNAITLVDNARKAAEEDEKIKSKKKSGGLPGEDSHLLLGFACGAYGACQCDGSEYSGSYKDHLTQQQLADWHSWRVGVARRDPRVDLLCFETIPCVKEIRAIVQLLDHPKSHSTPPLENSGSDRRPSPPSPPPPRPPSPNSPTAPLAPAWVSVSCKDGSHLCSGESFAEAVVPLLWACDSVVGIGINCTAPHHVASLLTAARQKLAQLHKQLGSAGHPSRSAASPLLLVYPNAGDGWDEVGRCWVPAPCGNSQPEAFAKQAEEWLRAAGTLAVGGCCRTGPEHIAALTSRLQSAEEKQADAGQVETIS